MANNFKVNSKTTILEFKRKHNELVDEVPNIVETAIEADKEILSKITVEYDEDEDKTYFIFPVGIMVLSIKINTHELFFKDNSLVNENGESVEGYELDEYYMDDHDNYILVNGNLSEQIINGLSYAKYDGYISHIRNTYHLFYPAPSGTKLYKHRLVNADNAGNSIISTSGHIITQTNLLTELLYALQGVIEVSSDGVNWEIVNQYTKGNWGIVNGKFDGTGGMQGFDIISDTVTEL